MVFMAGVGICFVNEIYANLSFQKCMQSCCIMTVKIEWFGGEPLCKCNFDFIIKILNKLARKFIKFNMEQFFVIGQNRLNGEVKIDSAKNSLLPIIACSILIEGEVRLENVPKYSDVLAMAKIIESLGGKVQFDGDDLIINCHILDNNCICNELASAVRSSIFALGPILGRMGSAKVAYPGGCDIGLRPIDLHLKGLRDLGAKVNEKNGYIYASGEGLVANNLTLTFPSVGATENLMMLATVIDGQTRIFNPAREPEIVDLQNFINSAGGDVHGAGGNEIIINGGRKLHSTSFHAMPDRIEAGTYIIAVAMCGGKVALKGAKICDNGALIAKLSKSACKIEEKGDNIIVSSDGKPKSFGEIETAVYPGFPTDLQAQMTALATVSEGYSLIIENLFENRCKHVGELIKMGANIRTRNGIIIVGGQEKLYGSQVTATDLRGGASLVLAGLCAEGYTTIDNISLIDRGYYKMEEKLGALGANIVRVDVEKEVDNCNL